MKYLVDTSVILDFLAQKQDMVDLLSNRLEEGMAISICVISEIYYGYWWLETKREKKKMEALEELLKDGLITTLKVDEAIGREYGYIQGLLRRSGKTLGVMDGIIAATARVNGLTLLTSDRDFFRVPKLDFELV
ncbi:type II toxin-antitoxin system VapC family toxin [Candidatus Collierbacteria bacterium]|nr:type II toxin-antitoxin system VapC family toxin [Candidatus Collierbacteria bacterium]